MDAGAPIPPAPAPDPRRVPRAMGFRVRVPALLLLPCAAFVLGGKIDRADGPRWRWSANDPEYAYLLNSVNIAEGHAPGHTHHPGTPVQTLGGAVLTARHLAVGAPGVPLRQQVLEDPPGALHAISVVLRFIHAVALGALGVAGLRLTGSLVGALAAQGATLLSVAAIMSLHAVAPEPLMLSIGLVLSASVMMCLARRGPVRRRFGVISGVLAAAGVATKVTFAPACLVAWGVLMRPGLHPRPRAWRLPLIHLAAAALALPLLLAPVLGHAETMLKWFKSLVMRDGYYGRSTGHMIVNVGEYPHQLWTLIEAEPATAAIALGGVILTAALFVPRLARRLDEPARRARAALAAVAAAQVIQFVLVAKHAAPRHLIPAVALSGLAVCLAFVLTRAVLPRPRVRWAVLAVAGAGLVYGGVATFLSLRTIMVERRELAGQQVALAREVERLASKPGRPGSGAVLVFTYWSSSPVCALHFGNHWAGFRFGDDLSRMFPDRVLYDVKAKAPFRDSKMVAVPREKLEAWAAKGRLYFHMAQHRLPEGFLYKQVGTADGLYRARLPK